MRARMAKKRKEPHTEPESIHVRLKPLFGYAPRVWLPLLLGALLLLFLLFLFVLPGITRPGAIVAVRSTPPGASVYVDGARVGATPIDLRLRSGTRDLELRRPFFAPLQQSVRVPNRLIGSRFFPARLPVHATLQLQHPHDLAQAAAMEFSGWSLIGSASSQYQFPWVLSNAVADLAVDDEALTGQGEALLSAALGDVRSDALLRDYLRATALAESGGTALLPVHLLEVYARLVDAVDHKPQIGTLLATSLSGSLKETLERSAWHRDSRDAHTTRLLPYTTEAGPGVTSDGTVTVAANRFRHLSAGSFVMGMPADASPAGAADSLDRPHVAQVEPFYIKETPVTRAQYRSFLAQSEYWREDNRETLIERGQATADYLSSWGYYDADGNPALDRTDGQLPANEISYYAAAAYSEWLTRQLPPRLQGWRVRLPYEAEYEWAVAANGSEGYEAGFRRSREQNQPYPVAQFAAGQYGVYDLLGNVWEWMEDWYRPADYLTRRHPHSPYGNSAAPRSAEKAVRGGSWVNTPQSVGAVTRGSQPPHWASPYLGFRPVISREQ